MNTHHNTSAPTSPDLARGPSASPVRYSRARPETLLHRAAELIARHGWIQTHFWPGPLEPDVPGDYIAGDPCCVLGALAVATRVLARSEVDWAVHNLPALRDASYALALVVAETPTVGQHGTDVALWNDEPERTAEQVIDALHNAAALIERLRVLRTENPTVENAVTERAAPSTKSLQPAGSPNHQNDSKENPHVRTA